MVPRTRCPRAKLHPGCGRKGGGEVRLYGTITHDLHALEKVFTKLRRAHPLDIPHLEDVPDQFGAELILADVIEELRFRGVGLEGLPIARWFQS
jgi:hypothetical protein